MLLSINAPLSVRMIWTTSPFLMSSCGSNHALGPTWDKTMDSFLVSFKHCSCVNLISSRDLVYVADIELYFDKNGADKNEPRPLQLLLVVVIKTLQKDASMTCS